MPVSYGSIRILPLPIELLMCIFKLATDNPLRDIDHFVDLQPFESVESRNHDEQCNVALKTKRSITLACSSFRSLCAELLYEDIRVGHGSAALADALERSEASSPGSGLGRLAKRAVLFPIAREDEGSTPSDRVGVHARRILACCTNVRAIYRLKTSVSSDEADEDKKIDSLQITSDALRFPSLQRIDWSSCPSDDPPVLAQIPHSVWSSESLKTLSVGVKEWATFTGMQETETISIFSNIITLRVRSLDAFGIPGQRLFTLELPALRRLVLDQPDSMYALFSIVQYGDQIDTLEFGLHRGFLEHDYVMVLLVYCPNVTDLYFPAFTTFVTRRNTAGRVFTYSIKRVVLHAALDEEADHVDDAWKWEHLTAQFETLCGEESRFGKLERIILHGTEWRGLVGDPRLRPSLLLLQSRRVTLFCEDDEARLLLAQNHGLEMSCEENARAQLESS